MSLFNFSQEELITFFAVLIRFGTLMAVLPVVGDRFVPAPVKVLLAMILSIAIFPGLVARGQVNVADAARWGASADSILVTVALEAAFGLALGFTARILFDSILFGANLVGTFMGFAAASTYDPHQESQTQVVAQIQMAIAMLVFLVLDGHHLMLRASLDSYRIVGLGKMGFSQMFSQRLIDFTGQTIRFGIQIAAPVAISLFTANVAFGVIAKAMPQINILVLSFAVTALAGLIIMFLSIPEFQGLTANILGRMEDWMMAMMMAMKADGA